MRLIMTLLVRDEEAIVRENIEYHLSRGVDFILATDNRSCDGTARILREYERAGVLRYLYEPGDDHSQDLWVSRMARMACDEHGGDWVFHVDADEFWWPEEAADLRQAFAGIGENVLALYVQRCNFQRARDCQAPFHVAMRWREHESRNPLGKPLPGKVAHRAATDIQLESGNHGLSIGGRRLEPARCCGMTVFHFPLRDIDQYRRKIRTGGAALARNVRLPASVGVTWREMYRLERAGALQGHLETKFADDRELAQRAARGELVLDGRFAAYMASIGPGRLHQESVQPEEARTACPSA